MRDKTNMVSQARLFIPTGAVTLPVLLMLFAVMPAAAPSLPGLNLPDEDMLRHIVVAGIAMLLLASLLVKGRRARRFRSRKDVVLAIKPYTPGAQFFLPVGLLLWMVTPFWLLMTPLPWFVLLSFAVFGANFVTLSRLNDKERLFFLNEGIRKADYPSRLIRWNNVVNYHWKENSENHATLYLNVAVTRFFGLRESITIRQEDLEEVLQVVAEQTGIPTN